MYSVTKGSPGRRPRKARPSPGVEEPPRGRRARQGGGEGRGGGAGGLQVSWGLSRVGPPGRRRWRGPVGTCPRAEGVASPSQALGQRLGCVLCGSLCADGAIGRRRLQGREPGRLQPQGCGPERRRGQLGEAQTGGRPRPGGQTSQPANGLGRRVGPAPEQCRDGVGCVPLGAPQASPGGTSPGLAHLGGAVGAERCPVGTPGCRLCWEGPRRWPRWSVCVQDSGSR